MIKYYQKKVDIFICIYLQGSKYRLFTVENCIGFNQYLQLIGAVEIINRDIYKYKNDLNK